MDLYRRKLITAEQAAALVKNNDTVDYFAFNAGSQYLDAALAKRAGELENVVIRSESRLAPPMQVFIADADGKSFRLESLFRGPLENLVPADRVSPIPACLGSYEQIFRNGDITTDIAAFQVSPPDNEGYIHFSPSPSLAKADAQTAKVFVAEINETYFHLDGNDDCRLHLSEVDYVVEGNNPPIMDIPTPPSSEADAKIAEYVMGELCDGACLQVGVGSVPNAVANLIAHSDLKDLGIHSEMLPDSAVKLFETGKVNGARKKTDPGKMVASFVLGSRRLVDFVRDSGQVRMCTCTYTNNPYVMGQNDNFISLNACLEIDLGGQVNSESIGTRVITGTGGQLDFVLGSQMSKGGKSLICCPSTYLRKDGSGGKQLASRIVPKLTFGSTVTTPRSCIQYVITEYGIVNLRGKSLWDRAELLISIAHPDFRDELTAEAKAMKVLR